MWTPGICMMFLGVPVFSVVISSARRISAMRSHVFAESVLDERVSVVTGGGTGLGKAAARELAACGAQVVIAGRREEVLANAVAEIGPAVSYEVGDVREPADAERIVRAALDRHGRLDVLVN